MVGGCHRARVLPPLDQLGGDMGRGRVYGTVVMERRDRVGAVWPVEREDHQSLGGIRRVSQTTEHLLFRSRRGSIEVQNVNVVINSPI